MMHYVKNDTHMETWTHETRQTPVEESWMEWITEIEIATGFVDGNVAEDGYSIDLYYDLWKQGKTTGEAMKLTNRLP